MALELPVGDDISQLTDWVERRVASEESGLTLGELDRLLKAEGTDTAEEEIENGGAKDAEVEVHASAEAMASAEVDVRVELVRAEVLERAKIGSKVYPFSAVEERLEARDACGGDVYLLLLVLGTEGLPYRHDRRAHEVEEAYDHIAMAALRRFLGRHADGVRFARTARADDSPEAEEADPRLRPTNFPKAILWLRDWLDVRGYGVRDSESIENTVDHWEDADFDGPPPLGREPLSSYNDAGVDVVVWWRFADGRSGFPVLLAQCTVQVDWEKKLRDINLDLWQKWIDFDTVPPQRALVIPFADRRDHPLWTDRTTEAGIILDRVRLVELLDELECGELEGLTNDRIKEWTQQELAAA